MHAGQDARRFVAAVFVLVATNDDKAVRGYYTLSSFGIEKDGLPADFIKKLPPYPVIPATLLGRLAVDRTLAGRGIGEFLLIDALRRTFEQSRAIASAALVVDAIDENASRFYAHFDFISLPDQRSRLFLPMATIGKLFKDD